MCAPRLHSACENCIAAQAPKPRPMTTAGLLSKRSSSASLLIAGPTSPVKIAGTTCVLSCSGQSGVAGECVVGSSWGNSQERAPARLDSPMAVLNASKACAPAIPEKPMESSKHMTWMGEAGEGARSLAGNMRGIGNFLPARGSWGPGMMGSQGSPEWKALMNLLRRSSSVSAYFGILCPCSCHTTSRQEGSQCSTRSSKSKGEVVSSTRLQVWKSGTLSVVFGRYLDALNSFGQRVDMQRRNLNLSCRSGRPSSASLASWMQSSPPAEKPQRPSTGPFSIRILATVSIASPRPSQTSSGDRSLLVNHVLCGPNCAEGTCCSLRAASTVLLGLGDSRSLSTYSISTSSLHSLSMKFMVICSFIKAALASMP
mmetsp:Transcript_121226/g.354357  ORF Transcript_121226/g.354357 Transcript_121226/m.354357 type:complete len:371 (-) Transcript_121226:186-1298(-)